MEVIFFLLIIAFISYVVYSWLDDKSDTLLEKRLLKFSQVKESEKKIEKTQKVSLQEKIFDLIEPLIAGILKKKKNIKSIKQLLLEAGKPSGNEEVFKFMSYKVILAAMGVGFSLLLSMMWETSALMKLSLFITALFGCYIIPDFHLKRIIKTRTEEITYNLPDALDLLTVCVEAGLGLDLALSRVAQEQSRTSPIMARELTRVSKDIQAGISRQEAFRNLSNRNNVPDLKTFVALLIQTDKLGTSIAQSLRVYSDTVRTKRRQRVETLAAKASVKMIIPLVLFILPSMFVVILAPAMINLIKNFKSTGF